MAYFLRKTSKKRGVYLQIYSSFRVPGKPNPQQKCHQTLGYVEDLIAGGLSDPESYYRQVVKELNDEAAAKKQAAREQQVSSVSPVRHLGFFPLQEILHRLDLAEDFDLLFLKRHFQSSIYEWFTAFVFARAICPCSKHKTLESVLPNLYSNYSFSYDQTLNYLKEVGHEYQKIVEIFTHHVKETYDLNTDSVLFDCTNYYFETDREDDFRRKEKSKENRKDLIVGMGLLLDANAIPIGMKLYPGNESEQPVLRSVISELKQQGNIEGRTIQVADKGLNSARNIHQAILAKDGYIFSKSIKKLSKKERKWVLNDSDYIEILDADEKIKFKLKSCVDEFEYSYANPAGKGTIKFKVKEKRVVTYNPKLAAKQTIEIKKMVEKAKACAYAAARKSEYGEAAKYVDFISQDANGEINEEKAVPVLNETKIQEDLEVCGYNMLVTSEYKLDSKDIYDKYHELWKIEETFRCTKSELDARPVYLQDKDKIKGHFLICYVAVLLERLFQFKVLENKFGSHKVYDFIKNFDVVPIGNYRYMNLAPRTEVMEFLSEKYHLPVLNCYLKESQIKKVLDRAV